MNATSLSEPAGDGSISTGVGFTALGVAAARAAETARPDRVCADPYADALVAAADSPTRLPTRLPDLRRQGFDEELAAVWEAMVGQMGLRTRFFDDYAAQAAAAGVDQVVILAAGLDTRACRLDWPAGTQVWELDQPRVLAFKDEVLDAQGAWPRCRRHMVPVDLRDDWPSALTQAGFDPAASTAWLVEGLLPYLPEPAERALFARITALSVPDSHVGLHDSHDLTSRLRDSRLERLSERFGMNPLAWMYTEPTRPDPAAWFREQGWRVTDATAGVLAERYHRRLPPQMVELLADGSHYYTAYLPASETREQR